MTPTSGTLPLGKRSPHHLSWLWTATESETMGQLDVDLFRNVRGIKAFVAHGVVPRIRRDRDLAAVACRVAAEELRVLAKWAAGRAGRLTREDKP